MSILNVSELAFRHVSQSEWLFKDVSFEIKPQDRIGLIGPNGAGKTTLLGILTGELGPNSGSIAIRKGLRIGTIPQESPVGESESLEDFVLRAFPEIRRLRRELQGLEPRLDTDSIAGRYADLLAVYEEHGGYSAEADSRRVLEGLGFDDRERRLRMDHLSSGQRARGHLAKLLLTPVDLLLIDEPTNHLDIAAQQWLENYLAGLDLPYVMVTHDRTFLSGSTNRIFEIRRGVLTVFEGGYAFYREQQGLQNRQAWERYLGQQRRIDAARQASERRMRLARKMTDTSPGKRRNHDPYDDSFYARKAGKVQRTARILTERVEREPEIPKPWEEDPIPVLHFPNVARTGDTVLQVDCLSKSFGEKELFTGLKFSVRRGHRLAILGPNGSGKTTLLRILIDEEKPDGGEVKFGAQVKIGYFAQEGSNLDPSLSPVGICRAVHGDETWVRTILGCLKVRGEQANQPVGTMSGGERGKVALARLLLSGANLLLLDEPTNHLDLEAREAVEGTLSQFPGTILFVSHDRFFIEALADQVIDLGVD